MTDTAYCLGIHIGHDCNVTAMDPDGNILFAAGEERFNRRKMFAGFPEQSLKYVFDQWGKNVSHLATARMSMRRKVLRELGFFCSSFLHHRAAPRFTIWLKNGFSKLFDGRTLEATVHETGIDPEWPVANVEHHRAHAAGAFYHSGFESAWVMTLDGEGDGLSCAFYKASRSTGIHSRKHYFHNEVTVGRDYEKVTAMLGFHPLRHPGKITGLAAYGKRNDDCIETLQTYLASGWKSDRMRILDPSTAYQVIDSSGIRQLREERDTIFGQFSREDIAFAVQWLTERKVEALIRQNIPDPATTDICLAGGVFANVAVNRRVQEMGFRSIFVMPAMTDCGLSLGACMHSHPKRGNIPAAETMYLGNHYSADTIRATLDDLGVAYTQPSNMAKHVAELLAAGKVIARFDGPMEFGPRALGNRSILYHCGDPTVNDWLNKQLKRTEFMPFAPVTMESFAPERYLGYEGAERTAKFMTITFECSSVMRDEAPAVVHVDGTARPQIINASQNPGYYAILESYYELTGIPTLVNTSFNMHEEPIVRTPQEALMAFDASALDALIAGPCLVQRA